MLETCIQKYNFFKALEFFLSSEPYRISEMHKRNNLEQEINDILNNIGYRVEWQEGFQSYLMIGTQQEMASIAGTPLFDGAIKEKLKEILSSANYLIWAHVAYLTDEGILDILKKKASEGVNVQVIVNVDKSIGKEKALKYAGEYDFFAVPNFGNFKTNANHEKFFIVDMLDVYMGSYNWTPGADFNTESVVPLRGKIVQEYAERFINLKNRFSNFQITSRHINPCNQHVMWLRDQCKIE